MEWQHDRTIRAHSGMHGDQKFILSPVTDPSCHTRREVGASCCETFFDKRHKTTRKGTSVIDLCCVGITRCVALRTTRSMPTKIIPYVGTVVNIRAKKSDIDAYSKGGLDFDKFHERIQIFTHYK